MAGIQHNAHSIAAAWFERGTRLEQVVRAELYAQAGKIAVALKARVAKFQSTTADSINVHEEGPESLVVAPGTTYAWYIEKGVKPGGKGLPRYFDPAAKDMQDWLVAKLRGSARTPKRGSSAFVAAERALRDAYEAMAWHIRHYGVKAQPFVEPTAREMAPGVAQALRAAVMRGMA